VTNDAALAAKMLKLRVHGMEPKYYHELIGGNFRLDEIQAAVLNVKLPHLDDWSAARQRNATFYDTAFARAGLAPQVTTPPPAPRGSRHIYNQYCIRAERRDELRAHLTAHGVGAEIYYPPATAHAAVFRLSRARTRGFPGVIARLARDTGTADLPGAVRGSIAVRRRLHQGLFPGLITSQIQRPADTIPGLFRL
jgi:dTDP-4-amino-4,6-dideoxygalactose transaminase